jgi:hypothetical protein
MLKLPAWYKWLLGGLVAAFVIWVAWTSPPPGVPPYEKTAEQPADEIAHQNTTNDWIAAATVVLAAFTGVLIAVGWVQSGHLKRSVDEAKAASIRELRAYINHREGSVVDWNTDCPILQASFTNFGKTPAHDVSYRAMIRTAAVPLAEELKLEESSINSFVGVLGPTSTFQMRWALKDPKLSDTTRALIREGKKGLYAYGKIIYTDTFGRDRWTTFRLLFTDADPTARDGQLAVCEKGNDADRDAGLSQTGYPPPDSYVK